MFIVDIYIVDQHGETQFGVWFLGSPLVFHVGTPMWWTNLFLLTMTGDGKHTTHKHGDFWDGLPSGKLT